MVKHWLARFPDLALHAEVTPLEFLMRVAAGDRSLSSLQLRAARAALPYMHAPGCGIDPSPRLKATLVRIAEIKAGEG